MLASGKSTLVHALAQHWLGSPILAFDEYAQHATWPSNMQKWLQDGADPEQVSNRRLHDDLAALIDGREALHPLTGITLAPAPLVLLEDPFGRTRPDIAAWIDYVLFIDIPTDVSIIRLVQRTLALSATRSSRTAAATSDARAAERIDEVLQWLNHYLAHRDMYTSPQLIEPIRDSSDVVLSGDGAPSTVKEDAVFHIEQWMKAGT